MSTEDIRWIVGCLFLILSFAKLCEIANIMERIATQLEDEES